MEKTITDKQITEAADQKYFKRYSGFLNEQRALDESRIQHIEGFIEGAKWAKKMLEPRMMFMGQYVDELNEEDKEVFDAYVRNNPSLVSKYGL